MQDKTIIYIAGYGRSGSTLLARILGSHENIFTAGELINFLNLVGGGTTACSCGRMLHRCNFWSSIFRQFAADCHDIANLKKKQRHMESIACVLKNQYRCNSDSAVRYGSSMRKILDLIFKNLPGHVRYIVDSSKTTWSRFFRPFMLFRFCGYNVKVIHIVRDGRGCMWSMMKGTDTGLLEGMRLKRKSSFPGLRTAVHWSIANLAAHFFQACHPKENYCRIRYEDMIDKPEQVYRLMGEFLGISLVRQVEIIRNEGELSPGHVMAGNRMRSSKKIRIKADVEWKENLHSRYEFLFLFMNWPLMFFYKYGLKRSGRT